MTKLFDQLEKADRERGLLQKQTSRYHVRLKKQLQSFLPKDDALRSPSLEIEEEMISLYRNILALSPNETQSKVVQFVSAYHNEGASVLIRELAKVAAVKLNQLVLLLDMDPAARQFNYFNIIPEKGWKEAILEDKPFNEVHYQVGDSNLYLGQIAMSRDFITQIVHSSWIDTFLSQLRQEFDLILMDSPPITESSDSLTITEKVDGVVLVVESEKTRWQILQEIKNNIELRNGHVLGVVLNKKRNYIPRFLYHRI